MGQSSPGPTRPSEYIAGADDNYRLTIGEGEGTGFDVMAYHNNQQFSTYDRDNDNWVGVNCAFSRQGGWWYDGCYYANLNGPHTVPSNPRVDPVFAKLIWSDGTGYQNLILCNAVEMKIRVKQCLQFQKLVKSITETV